MAVAFRSSASGTAGNIGASFSVNKPAGTADGDILIAGIYIEDDVALTAPAGWTLIATVDDPAVAYDGYVYWKRAASEGGTWAWTYTGTHWVDGWVAAFSGGVGSGSPIDGTPTSTSGTDATAECASITLAETDSMILAIGFWWSGNTATAPTGTPTFTERVDTGNNAYCATASATASGATGSKVINILSATNWSSYQVGVRSQVTGGAFDPTTLPFTLSAMPSHGQQIGQY